MKKVMDAFRKLLRLRIRLYTIWLAAAFIVIISLLPARIQTVSFDIAAIALFLILALGIRSYMLREAYLNKLFRKAFRNPYHAEAFQTVFPKEIDNSIRFEETVEKITMFASPNWFVYISLRDSLIVPRKEIRRFYAELVPSRSEHALMIDLADNTTFVSQCDACHEIINLLEEKRYFQ